MARLEGRPTTPATAPRPLPGRTVAGQGVTDDAPLGLFDKPPDRDRAPQTHVRPVLSGGLPPALVLGPLGRLLSPAQGLEAVGGAPPRPPFSPPGRSEPTQGRGRPPTLPVVEDRLRVGWVRGRPTGPQKRRPTPTRDRPRPRTDGRPSDRPPTAPRETNALGPRNDRETPRRRRLVGHAPAVLVPEGRPRLAAARLLRLRGETPPRDTAPRLAPCVAPVAPGLALADGRVEGRLRPVVRVGHTVRQGPPFPAARRGEVGRVLPALALPHAETSTVDEVILEGPLVRDVWVPYGAF